MSTMQTYVLFAAVILFLGGTSAATLPGDPRSSQSSSQSEEDYSLDLGLVSEVTDAEPELHEEVAGADKTEDVNTSFTDSDASSTSESEEDSSEYFYMEEDEPSSTPESEEEQQNFENAVFVEALLSSMLGLFFQG